MVPLYVQKLYSRTLKGNGFIRSVLVLSGGTIFGQILLLMASVVLTRLYSPSDFGVLTAFSALLAFGTVLTTLRYDIAIPLPDEHSDAMSLLGLCLVIITTVCLLVGIGVLFFRYEVASLLNVPKLESLLWLLPVGLAGIGTYNSFYYLRVRQKDYPRIARTRIVQSVSQLVVQIGSGLLSPSAWGLVFGQIAGQVGGIGSLSKGILKPGQGFWTAQRPPNLISVGRRYKRFPLYLLPASLLNAASLQLPTLLLTALFGTVVAGWYGLSYRVLMTPMTLVGQAIATVFFAESSAVTKSTDVRRYATKTFSGLVVVGMGPLLLLGLVAPSLFELLFGSQWRMAGVYAQWLVPWLFLVLIASPLSSLVFVMERQRGELIFQSSLLVTRIAAFYGGYFLFGVATAAMALYGISGSVIWLVYVLWLMSIAGISVRATLDILVRELFVSMIFVTPAAVVSLLIKNEIYGVLAAGVCGVGLVIRILFRVRELKQKP